MKFRLNIKTLNNCFKCGYAGETLCDDAPWEELHGELPFLRLLRGSVRSHSTVRWFRLHTGPGPR